MESGIACVVLHEKKNFSHGCYNILYKQKFSMIINLTKLDVAYNSSTWDVVFIYVNDYDVELNTFLNSICKNKTAVYLEMGNGMLKTAQLNIKELCKLPYLITAIGEELGIDISQPFNPEEPKALYGFKGEF